MQYRGDAVAAAQVLVGLRMGCWSAEQAAVVIGGRNAVAALVPAGSELQHRKQFRLARGTYETATALKHSLLAFAQESGLDQEIELLLATA